MAKRPIADDGLICPLHKARTEDVCHKCPWWLPVKFRDPQTGGDVDDWACAVAWLPGLMIEAAQQARQGAAATESFRNAVVRQIDGEIVDAQRRLL